MKLSTLVAYRNKLMSMTPIDTAPLVHDKLAPILHEVKVNEFQAPDITEQLEKDYFKILDTIGEFKSTVERVKESIDSTISHLEREYYQESKSLYHDMMMYDSVEHILNRVPSLTDSAKSFLSARIQMHGDWRHAGMIIRPGREEWITMLVGCDPLYLVDTNLGLMEPAVLRFNDQYQRRLRTYEVNETANDSPLSELPAEQFAFCLAYNFFNFKPIFVIKSYLTDLFQRMKPGGTVAFTFNDCDRPGGVDLAERHFMFYTPGREIIQHLNDVGFQITQRYFVDAACTWLEVKKPGTLTSLRGGQSLARIVPNGQ